MCQNKNQKDKKKPFDTDIRNFENKRKVTKNRKVSYPVKDRNLGQQKR